MLYSAIVKTRIRQSFDHVINHRWDELLGSIAPDVHHRFLGTHAIGGERHDKETLHSMSLKTRKKSLVRSPSKRQPVSKKLPPNRS